MWTSIYLAADIARQLANHVSTKVQFLFPTFYSYFFYIKCSGELGITKIDNIDPGLDSWLSVVSGADHGGKGLAPAPDKGLQYLHQITGAERAGTKRKFNDEGTIVENQEQK